MKIISYIYAINSYFFDIEENEPIDWLSVSLFYGVIVLALTMAVGIWLIK